MEFRWLALLSLWTLLSGPILAHPMRWSPAQTQSAEQLEAPPPPLKLPD
ncbi:hypothetical protein [Tuwongella immobilis]|uniref:Uncharacterized protein n=1 Tax=Tuwongella immobilis TaxID=692036 RepID=A0A6C2YPB3_9BACT|nr:hypothetical protein [Tuwongella immobilis]VIP03244.1 unnamed protein product [Tuwongella immobilis]VTS03819.1 unnamed protein product [Tuwongella immobilis]